MLSANIVRLRRGAALPLARLSRPSAEVAGLLATAAPVAATALLNMCKSVTDTLMAAALGVKALAAAGDRPGLGRLGASGWAVALIFGLPMAVAVWTSPGWLGWFGIEPMLLDRGEGYARAMALTLLPMLAAGVLRTRLVAAERAGALFRVTIAAVPLNAALNTLLMFGIGGPGLGLTGAGVSSFLVACFTFAVFAQLARRTGDSGTLLAPDRRTVAEILRLGLPIGIATLSDVGVFLGATLFIAMLSVADAAAHVLAIRVAGFTFAVSIGLLQATPVRMARAGADPSRQRAIAGLSMQLSGVAARLLAGGVALAAWPLSQTLPGEAAGIAMILLRLVAACELAGPLGAAASGLLRGLGITRVPMAISLLGNWLIAAPLGVLLATVCGLGATGVWVGLAAGSATASIFTLLHLWRILRRHTL